MTNQVDVKGFYELRKHVVVEFLIEGVSAVNLQDVWDRSILLSLGIDKSEAGFRLGFSAAYGLSGTVEVASIALRITPGKPSEGV